MHSVSPHLKAATDFIQSKTSVSPKAAIVLGSGLGAFAAEIDEPLEIQAADIPGSSVSTVSGHAGKWIFGSIEKKPVVALQGRVHVYEGYALEQVTFAIQLLANLEVQYLIVTNAAGGLNRQFRAGDLMLINDHINLMFDNPLIGINDNALGPRFPDMSQPYDRNLQKIAKEAAMDLSIPLHSGILGGLKGPTYETAAEVRMMQLLGADAGTMSTVPEVIVAVFRGLRVLGISCITNQGTGMTSCKLSHDEVTVVADMVQNKFSRLIREIIIRID